MNLPVGYRVPSSDITKMSYFAVLDSDDSGNEGPKPKAKAPAKASAAAPGASQAPAPAPSKEGPKKEKQAANGGSKPKGIGIRGIFDLQFHSFFATFGSSTIWARFFLAMHRYNL